MSTSILANTDSWTPRIDLSNMAQSLLSPCLTIAMPLVSLCILSASDKSGLTFLAQSLEVSRLTPPESLRKSCPNSITFSASTGNSLQKPPRLLQNCTRRSFCCLLFTCSPHEQRHSPFSHSCFISLTSGLSHSHFTNSSRPLLPHTSEHGPSLRFTFSHSHSASCIQCLTSFRLFEPHPPYLLRPVLVPPLSRAGFGAFPSSFPLWS